MATIAKVELNTLNCEGEIINVGATFKLTSEEMMNLTPIPNEMLSDVGKRFGEYVERMPVYTTFKQIDGTDTPVEHRAVALLAKSENTTRVSERNFNGLYFVEVYGNWIAFQYREDVDEDGNITPWHGEIFGMSEKAMKIVKRRYQIA